MALQKVLLADETLLKSVASGNAKFDETIRDYLLWDRVNNLLTKFQQI